MRTLDKRASLFIFCLWALALTEGCYADGTSISVVPQRIQLGSLPFGQEQRSPIQARLAISGLPSGVQLIDVDCSHAPGVSVVSRVDDNGKVVLNLKINEAELCHAEPFGAFIKKELRLQTNSPNEPQFVVPIIGWIDVNNTPRDFNQFVFRGATRWKGIWPTPNVAGALLCAASLFSIGGIAWFRQCFQQRRSWWIMLGLWIAVATMGLGLFFLSVTYSRGAWLAFFFALGAVSIWNPNLRRVALVAATLFSAILLLLPSGVERLQSYATVQDDLSIANRFKLWEGALQMMAVNPVSGVGSGQFESTFEHDYQTFAHTAKTSTAVSDYLTLGAEHGLIALSLALGFLLTIISLSFREIVKNRDILVSTLAAILVGMLITSCFSTLCILPDYQWLSAVTILTLCGFVVFRGIRESGTPAFARYSLKRVFKTTAVTFIVLSLASIASLCILPTRSSTIVLSPSQGTTVSYQGFEPRWKATHGIVLFLTDCSHPELLFHSTIRPMAAMGWKVIAVPESTSSAHLHDLVASLHQSAPHLNLFVAGDLKGGRFAWTFAAQESPDTVRAGGGFDFLSTDLDVAANGNSPHQPFLVYQSLYSEGASSNAAICAQNKVAFTGLPLTVVLSTDNTSRFSAGWMTFLVTLSDFFQRENYYASK